VPGQDRPAVARARASALLIALFCGLNWPAVRTVLGEVGPWTLRATCLGLGAAVLFGLGAWRGHRLTLPSGRQRLHLVIAGLFNVGFSAC
jgi:drug/metabolite transporter (DMT)-like permease